jgi:hypothetical protein
VHPLRRKIYHCAFTDAGVAALSDQGTSSGEEEIPPRTAKTDEVEEVEDEDSEGEDEPDQ